MRIYLDIETLPGMAPDARALARAGVKPPGNYKKPETIAAWWATEGEAATDDAYRRQALDAAVGELCAVGFALDDGAPVSLVRALEEPEPAFLARALGAIGQLVDAAGYTGPDGTRWPVEPFFASATTPAASTCRSCGGDAWCMASGRRSSCRARQRRGAATTATP